MRKENKIAATIQITGFFIIQIGFMASFFLGKQIPTITIHYEYVEESYNWALAIGGSVGSFLTGLLFLGFSELIELLSEIEKSLYTAAIGISFVTFIIREKQSAQQNL